MTYLILGLGLFTFAHLAHRIVPDFVKGIPTVPRKIVIALILIFSVWLMIKGYPMASAETLWSAPQSVRHIGFAAIVLAFILYVGSYPGSALRARVRHPQLTGFKIWAVVHLIVNGDVRSVVLFGGLLAWAVAEVVVLNRASGKPALPHASDNVIIAWAAIPVGLAAWVLFFAGHAWLIGVSPLG